MSWLEETWNVVTTREQGCNYADVVTDSGRVVVRFPAPLFDRAWSMVTWRNDAARRAQRCTMAA